MATPYTTSPASNTPTVTGMDEFNKILNKKVDLITNSNIRYEGELIKIKQEDRRLILKDVKSFGTEGRNNGINEIPVPLHDDPNNIYALVEFQIPMIRELYLAKVEGPVLEDPAIVAVKQEEAQEPIGKEQKEKVEPELERFKPDDDSKIPQNKGLFSNDFFDDDNKELEDEEYHPRGGYRSGYRRGRARRGHRGSQRGRGGYRNNKYNPHGKFDKDPDYHLQERFKDDFFK